MSKYVFGIDLGTTYSCISRVDDTGRAEVIKNNEGDNITPSVVLFEGNDVIVGNDAKAEAVLNPETTVMLVKTLMGKQDFAIRYDNKDRSPEEISSYILKKLTKDASEQLGVEVKDVVITCPAYFGTAERTATKRAGEIAGLNVLEIISEPTAAALYYGSSNQQNEKVILVYDLGGGTFDVTIMKISSDRIEIICSDGDHDLGGKNWDEELIKYLAKQFVENNGEVDFDDYATQDLRLKAEKMKKQLTSKSQASDMLEVNGKRGKITITREKFDELTSVLLKETIIKTDEAVRIASEKGYNKIDEILLVGGSTRMPQVKEKLSEQYRGIEIKILEPDEAVAKGAAIHAVNVYVNKQKNILEGNTENIDNTDDYKENLSVSALMSNNKIKEIVIATTKSFGIGAVDSYVNEMKCFNLIIKNQAMESGIIERSKEFYTIENNQNYVDMKIYENDYMDEKIDIDEELLLGSLKLELPYGLPGGSPISVTFKLNNEGILEIIGRELSQNREVKTTLKTKGILSEEQVENVKKQVNSMKIR